MVLAGLGWLASADLASVPVAVQAECLRGLERAASVHAAARARVLAAFTARGGQEADGHGSARTWLTWQTRVTRQAAAAALAAMRRLDAHPGVARALGDGAVSTSWARQICDWTDRLPAAARQDADAILLAAAAAGADLPGLAGLAEEMRARLARPDRDRDGFEDRGLRLSTTLGGAGRLHADLTPQCAAALRAVLDALGSKAGPEDARTCPQRDHDALEEACRRLAAAGNLPDRAGQPTRIQLHITLDELIRRIQDAGGPAGDGVPGWPAAAPGYDCDASIAPVVTGRVDHDLLDRLARRLSRPAGRHAGRGTRGHPRQRRRPALRPRRPRVLPAHRHPPPPRRLHQPAPGRRHHHRHHPPAPATRRHPARQALRRPRLRPATRRLPDPPPDSRAAKAGRPGSPT